MRGNIRLLYIIMCGMAAFLAASCQGDLPGGEDAGEGTAVTITLDIHSRANGTRATGVPEGAEYDIEKIHSWWVAFVNQGDRKVQAIVERPAGNTSYVEQESVDMKVAKGKYVLYAFANISQDSLRRQTGLQFMPGETCPDVDAATLTLLQDWNPGTDIPMTGKQQVEVTGHNSVSIEVVRMLAKMDVTFTNESGKDITINSMTMEQSPTDQVPLLPNYSYLQNGMPEAADTAGARAYVRDYRGAASLKKYAGGTARSYRDVFYVRESQSRTVTRRYRLAVSVTREGDAASTQLFALTRDLYSIYRNDHVVVPIVLSDFQVGVDARFYPPIGGYPAVVTSGSGEDFYCEFGTEGDFELFLSVRDALKGNALVYGAGDPCYSSVVKAVNDPQNILTKYPSVSATGEIVGRLSSNRGKASVDVEVTVHRNGAADQVYDRRIYLIRK